MHLAAAHLAAAKLDYERAQRLFEQGSVSTAERDHASTAYQVAQAQVELARVALAYTEIRAPIRSTVIRKLRDVGEFLTIGVTASGDPGTSVVTLADLSEMRVDLEINETEIRKVAVGDVAIVAPEALRNRRYLADVTEVAATANRQKGMVSVKLRLRAPDGDLKPDMTANVSFLAGEPNGAVVGRRVLEPNQWRVGDRVALRSITGTPPLDVHIVGDIDGDDRLGGVVIVHIAYLEKLLGSEGLTTFIQARVTRPELAASVARALDERFASFSVPTETTTEKAHMATFVAGFSEVLGALQAIGMITLLVTLLVVANAVAMSVRERTVEIGTLRALGFGRGHLIGLVVSESVVVSFFGGIAGTVAAYVLFASGIIQLPGGTGVSISTDVAVLVRAAALSIPLGAMAGLQPAWSAVHVPITDALRHVD